VLQEIKFPYGLGSIKREGKTFTKLEKGLHLDCYRRMIGPATRGAVLELVGKRIFLGPYDPVVK